MSEIAGRYRRRADAFEALIAGVPTHRWTNQSPCEGWLARDIVAHVVGYSAYELQKTAGVEATAAPSVTEDPVAAFRAIRTDVERVLTDSSTPLDVAQYIDRSVSIDLPQHGWDLAKATAQDETIDPEDVDELWTAYSGMGPGWWKWQVDNGHFAPRVPVPEDAPLQDRLLGLIGRDPNWRSASE